MNEQRADRNEAVKLTKNMFGLLTVGSRNGTAGAKDGSLSTLSESQFTGSGSLTNTGSYYSSVASNMNVEEPQEPPAS
jgi:hypothetical protein